MSYPDLMKLNEKVFKRSIVADTVQNFVKCQNFGVKDLTRTELSTYLITYRRREGRGTKRHLSFLWSAPREISEKVTFREVSCFGFHVFTAT